MKVILLLVLSIAVGLLLRNIKQLRVLQHSATWTVWALLFVFGFTLGSNESIVRNFPHFGFTAIAISVGGVAGSVLTAWGAKTIIDRRRRRKLRKANTQDQQAEPEMRCQDVKAMNDDEIKEVSRKG